MASFTPPAVGQPNSTEDSKIETALTVLDNLLDSSDKVPAAGLAGSITDSLLASPNNSVYRTLLGAATGVVDTTTAATYCLTDDNPIASGSDLTGAIAPPLIYFDDADYTVASKTQKLRVRGQVLSNATAAAVNFTIGLYPVTVAGGADQIALTLGTVVSGSTVALNAPSASTVNQGNSGDFTIPSDGAYVLGFVLSGTPTANHESRVYAQLQTRHV